ncbi:hypothetical protein TWF694_007213 [Orbilia ellipsospora]|uniref:MARVEL domain-containing protein n=1 Tax=Orbilia ellipsospora TaxID=2528407 RepID=A0AAV9XIP8_9PEZI
MAAGMSTALWIIRSFEMCFAIILTGIFAWFHDRLFKAGAFPFESTDVPLGFSAASFFVICIAGYASIFLEQKSQVLIGFLDFCLLGGYIASAIVYRHNFNSNCRENTLVTVFNAEHEGGCNTVRLGAAMLILQILLYTASTIMAFAISRAPQPASREASVTSEKSLFGFRRRTQTPPAEVNLV